MKRITCKQMGGPCDEVFEGNTSGDIAKAAEKHISALAPNDPAHKATYDMMAKTASSPETHATWQQNFQKMFDEAPTS